MNDTGLSFSPGRAHEPDELSRLIEHDQRLAATYEHAGIAISEIDADGRLLRVNEATCTITGYTREELLALTIFDVTHPEDRRATGTRSVASLTARAIAT
jgi:PAS domain S-box-containing protein